MDKRLLTLLLVCMCATLGIQARTVKGTVVDKVNQPVIGASVHVNGTNLGAMTDVDGNFTISNAPDNAVLTFSYVGMVSKTVKAADGQMKIELADDVQNLEEVVVIGYGAAKAKDLTAPIEVVKGEKLIATPSSSPMTALQGKVAGVNIVNSGTPGEVLPLLSVVWAHSATPPLSMWLTVCSTTTSTSSTTPTFKTSPS